MTTQRTRSAGRPTLDEVAALAGVGRGTVSRVVNGSPQVSPEARSAVQEAIKELGYVPNRAARALVTQRTDSVALVVSESQERVFAEPFFAGIVRGISSALSDTSLQLWLAMAQTPAERQRVENHLTSQHVDGVLLVMLHESDNLVHLLNQRGLPAVLGGRPVSVDQKISYVDMDNVNGARTAVEYLLSSGRKRVATIAGPQDLGVGVDRLVGYRAAVQTAAVEPLIEFGDFSEYSGVEAMRRLLARRPDLDAVFVASDLMAAGAVRALRDAGRRIPEDVAVIGFEDSPVARQTEPPLTTVYQPVEDMGRHMVRLLLSRIRGEAEPSHILLDTHLVHRNSA
ncbi:LacI family DNA-binding transcriptional regulator [Catellatospora bangladeshensis]|uniref:LacI family transcriptional regulator n=1 Tax=Catellatospora bangladeshensis TaxID=310355 RepID=A0A8J3JVW1_9ACTN|nr:MULTISPECIES: LacI family DNA-binding transcriptional regulator [Catellatospora]BCJ73090.1 LacI family transcriptional regulator [Catellatospora sp. IY07-71]GIF84039.1 LacI family transcriptional regulator [Catellatospora bangladeshensis]